jgi:NAD(P)-dependent dehydrogenase (short-subunit alcohol dehydrogenase family)
MTQVWLITGSSRGLGRALAEAVLATGDKLLATARNPAQLADLRAKYGDHVRTFALDVTDPRAARDAVAAAVQSFGKLDVLVNNAGCEAKLPLRPNQKSSGSSPLQAAGRILGFDEQVRSDGRSHRNGNCHWWNAR